MFKAVRFVDEDLELEPELIPRSVRLPLDDILFNQMDCAPSNQPQSWFGSKLEVLLNCKSQDDE